MSAKLLQLLAHPVTQDAIVSLSRGSDPRGVLAGIAGDLVAQEVAKAIGARRVVKPGKAPEAPKAPTKEAAPGVKRRPKVEVISEDEVVDAEYTVIDVTPKASKRR